MNVALTAKELKASLPARPLRGRRPWSFLIVVALPTLLVLLYLSFIAAPQYATEFRFAILSQDSAATVNDSAQATSQSQPSTTPAVRADYLVLDYIKSRQVLEDLRKRLNLLQMLHARGADPVLGFWWDDGSPERLVQYWRNFVIDSEFDTLEGIGAVRVVAWTPQDSLRLSQALFEASEALVNEVSLRPRQEAVRFAEGAAKRAEAMLADAQKKQEIFRHQQATSNPDHTGDAQIAMVAQLQTSLAALNAQAASLHGRLAASAPSMQALTAQIAATDVELAKARAAIGRTDDGGSSLAQVVTDGKALDDQVTFALSFRNATVLRLEQARYDAEVQHQFMQLHVKPLLAKRPSYPRPLTSSFLVFCSLFVTWSVGTLLYFAMRDHTA